mmetsp:Transcript_47102/g.114745  ORF Transcript_47102/g.114745 Transcript_47102/m.114745 type:complete len:238 (+) Transcript_47102:736-1449(+)
MLRMPRALFMMWTERALVCKYKDTGEVATRDPRMTWDERIFFRRKYGRGHPAFGGKRLALFAKLQALGRDASLKVMLKEDAAQVTLGNQADRPFVVGQACMGWCAEQRKFVCLKREEPKAPTREGTISAQKILWTYTKKNGRKLLPGRELARAALSWGRRARRPAAPPSPGRTIRSRTAPAAPRARHPGRRAAGGPKENKPPPSALTSPAPPGQQAGAPLSAGECCPDPYRGRGGPA